MEISTRNLVDFYSEDLRNIKVRRLTATIPPGVLRQLRLLGIINSRRTYRNGKVLYLTEKGESILRENHFLETNPPIIPERLNKSK